MPPRYKIVSDGTSAGTKITFDGKQLEVISYSLRHAAGKSPIVVLELHGHDVDLDVTLPAQQVITKKHTTGPRGRI